MTLAWHLLILFGALLAVQEFFRRAGAWAGWLAFFVLPVMLTPYWLRQHVDIGFFPWVKLYSASASVAWLTALRYTKLGELRMARAAGWLILVVNICEAMLQDAFGRHVAHYLVVASGLLIVWQLPSARASLVVDRSGSWPEYRYRRMTRRWVVEYTAWNWAFVYLNYPQIAGHQFAVLGAALVVGFHDPTRWLQARGYTLATDLIAIATFPNAVIAWTDTSHWSTPWRENMVAAVCLFLCLSPVLRRVIWLAFLRSDFRRSNSGDAPNSGPGER
jgi:hypothetical protein